MKRLVVIFLVLIALVFGWELVLELLHHVLELMFHGVMIVLEYLELITEEGLEVGLAIAPREAQTLTAWLGMGLFLILLTLLVRKMMDWYQNFCSWFGPWCQEEKARFRELYATMGWPLIGLGLILIVAYFFLF